MIRPICGLELTFVYADRTLQRNPVVSQRGQLITLSDCGDDKIGQRCTKLPDLGDPSENYLPSRAWICATSSAASALIVSKPGRPQGRGSTSTTHTVPSATPVRSISGAPR